MNETRRATDSGIDINRGNRTVTHAGATLHASISVLYAHHALGRRENLMRADLETHSAGNTDVLIKPQGGYPVEIPESFHLYSCLIKNTHHRQHGPQRNTAGHNRQGNPHFFLHPRIGGVRCTAGKIERIKGTHRR